MALIVFIAAQLLVLRAQRDCFLVQLPQQFLATSPTTSTQHPFPHKSQQPFLGLAFPPPI
jgi:hypothetical protein